MKYSLSDFFIGIVHLFVIFLPGGILLAVLLYGFPELKDAGSSFGAAEAGGWLLFLAASFVLGHIVSLAGAGWEDWRWKISGGKRAKGEVSDKLRGTVRTILQDSLPASLVSDDKLRRWAIAILRQSDSPSYRDVERNDADRRFFRNLRVVLVAPIILFLVYAIQDMQYLLPAGATLALMYLSHRRYEDQDRKFTRVVFESLVVAQSPKGVFESSAKNKEIEKRFLVSGNEWRGRGTGIDIRQGYLSTVKERIVRIRVEGENAWITIKGKSAGASQPEYEYQIPVEDAKKMLANLCEDFVIEKTRYTIDVAGFAWELDEFKGLNDGLVLAEIEAENEAQLENALKSKPAWVGEDITSRYEYRNSNLAKRPYSEWSKEERAT